MVQERALTVVAALVAGVLLGLRSPSADLNVKGCYVMNLPESNFSRFFSTC